MRKIVAFYNSNNSMNFFFPDEKTSIREPEEVRGTGYNASGVICDDCKKKGDGHVLTELDQMYVKIIVSLKEAKLLDMSYPLMCCGCFSTRKMEKEYSKL